MTAAQLDGTWSVTHAKGLDLSGLRDLSLRFEGTSVYGVAPCKTFTAQLKTTDGSDTFRFGPVKRTPHICDEATMIADRSYFDVLDSVGSFSIDADGVLNLKRRDSILVTARNTVD